MKFCTNHPDRKAHRRDLCKSCYERFLKERNPEYAARERERYNAWVSANKERSLEIKKKYRDSEKGKTNAAEYRAVWLAKNKHVMCAQRMRRIAAQLRATPVWADSADIKCFYQEAEYFGLEVDHIVPLQSKVVCGLHVPENMQLLSRSDNARKGNKFDPMTHVWEPRNG